MRINIVANIPKAYELMERGALALSKVEQYGLRVDVDYLKTEITKAEKKIATISASVDGTDDFQQWKQYCRLSRKKLNLLNANQAAAVLFGILKHKAKTTTPSGKPSADDESLKAIGTPIAKAILEMRKLDKVKGTYLTALLREQIGGFVHPSYGLNVTVTYRSQSEGPNFQNMPIRDPMQGSLVRKAIFPRFGRRLGEVDYGQLEVRIAACYCQDPKLMQYVTDPTQDMHYDMSGECFILERENIAKPIRSTVKGGFVFAEFYGSYWASVAPALWEAISQYDLKTAEGVPLKEHLVDQGIKKLGRIIEDTKGRKAPEPGSFLAHIRDVEYRFWNERFSVYNDWRNESVARYHKDGYMDSLTGFRYSGEMTRKEIINYRIQGSAFHCLLWSLIELVEWETKNKMDSRVVCEIHDSMLNDMHPDEAGAVIEKANKVMCEDILSEYSWINVPLITEWELSGIDESWNEKTGKYTL